MMNCYSIYNWVGMCYNRVIGGFSMGLYIKYLGTRTSRGCWPGFIENYTAYSQYPNGYGYSGNSTIMCDWYGD